MKRYGHHMHRAFWLLIAIVVMIAVGNCSPKQQAMQADKTYAVVDVGQTLYVEWPEVTHTVKYLGLEGSTCKFEVDNEKYEVRLYTATSLPTGNGGMMDLHCKPNRPSGPVEVVVDETATISYD